MLQCTSARTVIITDAEQFLHIIVSHRSWEKVKYSIELHISLKFHHILISPGEKIPVFSAPVKKFSGSLFKRHTAHKVFIIHMNHFMNAVMDPVVNLWFDQPVKTVRYFFFAVYFYSSDLDNLEWKFVVASFLSRWILIPFQVKNYIVHLSIPFFACLYTSFSIINFFIKTILQ